MNSKTWEPCNSGLLNYDTTDVCTASFLLWEIWHLLDAKSTLSPSVKITLANGST